MAGANLVSSLDCYFSVQQEHPLRAQAEALPGGHPIGLMLS